MTRIRNPQVCVIAIALITGFVAVPCVAQSVEAEESESGNFDEALDELVSEGDMAATPQVTPQVKRLLTVCEGELSRAGLQGRLGLGDRKHFRSAYLLPALDAGLVEMTIPDKPTSSAQRYRLTPMGQRLALNPPSGTARTGARGRSDRA